jgi:flagellar assembly protein FliH
MSNRVIPKEQLSAYQRWELSALDDPQPAPDVNAVQLPTAEELDQIHQQAYQEGFAAGMKDGLQEAQTSVEAMNRLMGGLIESLQQFDQELADETLELAVEVAKQIVRESIRLKPDIAVSVVRDAMASLPHSNQHVILHLNPQDSALVRAYLDKEGHHGTWRIMEDAHIERGGCRLETASSEIDATVENRWKRIISALGSDINWIEP